MTELWNDSQSVGVNASDFEFEREGRRLLRLLQDGDPTASNDLANLFVDRLTTWLIGCNPKIHPNDCETAVGDTFISLAKNPASYRPEKLRFWSFLQMSAKADLKNIRRSEHRHQSRRSGSISVEQCSESGNAFSSESENPARLAEWREECERLQAAALQRDASLPKMTEGEAQVWKLRGENERKTTVYAKALGIEHLPPKEQAKEVKRLKDRLQKRLDRSGGGHVEQT